MKPDDFAFTYTFDLGNGSARMTDKTLDEKVAEALGWRLHESMDFYIDKKSQQPALRISGHKSPFFTADISNCKRYLERELIKACHTLAKICEYSDKDDAPWVVNGLSNSPCNIVFQGMGRTEEIAYCNAFLDLKKRESKCQ